MTLNDDHKDVHICKTCSSAAYMETPYIKYLPYIWNDFLETRHPPFDAIQNNCPSPFTYI